MSLHDKILLRKRSLIETVNDELKNVCQIEHTRHWSVDNFATNLLAGLFAYNLLPQKPAMNIDIIDKNRVLRLILVPNSRYCKFCHVLWEDDETKRQGDEVRRRGVPGFARYVPWTSVYVCFIL